MKKMIITLCLLLAPFLFVFSSTASAQLYTGGGFFGKLIGGGDCYVYLNRGFMGAAIKTDEKLWTKKLVSGEFENISWEQLPGVPGIQVYSIEKEVFETLTSTKLRISANINQSGQVVEASFKFNSLLSKTYRCVKMNPDNGPKGNWGYSKEVLRVY